MFGLSKKILGSDKKTQHLPFSNQVCVLSGARLCEKIEAALQGQAPQIGFSFRMALLSLVFKCHYLNLKS